VLIDVEKDSIINNVKSRLENCVVGQLRVVVHPCNASTKEAEIEGSQVWG
jgi:hypothetical protein